MEKFSSLFLLANILLIAILLWRLTPLDLTVYNPPKPELKRSLVPNNLLQKIELLALGKINSPEEGAVDKIGLVFGGLRDEKLLRLFPSDKFG